jgi:kumamolisin
MTERYAAKVRDRRELHAMGIGGKCYPYFQRRTYEEYKGMHYLPFDSSHPNGYLARDLAALYELPTGITAPVPTVWIPELGGGFDSTAIGTWCQQRGLPMPNLTSTGVLGATNQYSGDPNSADGEVVLDIAVVADTIPVMFNGRAANIAVVFAPNSIAGMVAAFQYVLANAKPGDSCSFSWGGPEDGATIAQLEPIFQQMAAKGISVTCASGDNGPDDGTSSPVTDYPGCSAWACDCGATTIQSDGTQVPWNSGGGASGGGFSKLVAKPSWQSSLPGSYRGEPDCVAMGDPTNGWDTPFGPVGGTSAVAPFMAAVFAAINAQWISNGHGAIGLPDPLMYKYEA